VEENETKKTSIRTGLLGVLCGGVVAGVIALAVYTSHQASGSTVSKTATTAQTIAAVSQPAATQAPAQPPSTPEPPVKSESATSVPAPVDTKPPSDNCHDSPGFQDLSDKSGHPTSSKGRQEYAEKVNTTMPSGMGMFVNAGGDDSQYLLFVGPPESEAYLLQLATRLRTD
jgi:S-formylglutathione hydrolase FrmB